jgi:aromatic ring hydroxylase
MKTYFDVHISTQNSYTKKFTVTKTPYQLTNVMAVLAQWNQAIDTNATKAPDFDSACITELHSRTTDGDEYTYRYNVGCRDKREVPWQLCVIRGD